jgi:hypothetical protein
MNRLAFTFGMGTAAGLFVGQNHSDKVEFCLTALSKALYPTQVSE